MTDRIYPEEFYSKAQIENAKRLGQIARERLGGGYMSEAELTENQRESREPIGTKGYYRMYRWECVVCSTHGKKMPYTEAIISGGNHAKEYNHKPDVSNPPVKIVGGVFPRTELYTE